MSRKEGSDEFICDRCGADVENAALDKCVVISHIDWESGLVENNHLCNFVELNPDGSFKEATGCAQEILFASLDARNKRLSKKAARKRAPAAAKRAPAKRAAKRK